MTRRPPALDGYPDARPFRDGLRMYRWTLRGFAHGAARRKSKSGARLFSGLMLLICIVAAPGFVLLYPGMIAWRRSTRYYMTPERDATLAITAKRDAWHLADHITARPGSQRGRAFRRGIAPSLTPALDQAGAALLTVAVNEERAQDYSEDVPGLASQGRAWPRGVKMRREPQVIVHNQDVSRSAPKELSWANRNYGWLVTAGVILYLAFALFAVINFPRELLNNWIPGLDQQEKSKLLGAAGNLVLLSAGGVVAVVGVGISLSRHHQELEAAQRDRDRLNDDRDRERARRDEVDAQRRVETERTLRERFVTTVQLLSDPSPVNRQAALFALGSLADDWDAFGKPDEVQVCIEVLTGYLRAPRSNDMLVELTAEEHHAYVDDEERRFAQSTMPQEIAAKQAGYIVIRNHLQVGAAPGWHDRTLNLAGAHIDFAVDLTRIALTSGSVSFESARIVSNGHVRLDGMRAGERAMVSFDSATVARGDVTFHSCHVEETGSLSFEGVGVVNGGHLDLRRARIRGYLNFEDARLASEGKVMLSRAQIQGSGTVSFAGVMVGNDGSIEIRDARIDDDGRLSLAVARIATGGRVDLSGTSITDEGIVYLRGAVVSARGLAVTGAKVLDPGRVTLPDKTRLQDALDREGSTDQ